MSELDTRARFLAAAIALATAGRGRFTLKDLCTETGLTIKDFRQIFGSKAALIDAARELAPEVIEEDRPRPIKPTLAGDDQWVERRFRVLERAIASLETQLSDLRNKCAQNTSIKAEDALPETVASNDIAPVVFCPEQPSTIDIPIADLPAASANNEPQPVQTGPRASASAHVPDSYWSVATKLATVPERIRPRQMLLVLLLAVLCGVMAGVLMPMTGRNSGHPKSAIVAARGWIAKRAAPHPDTLLERASRGEIGAQRQLALAYLRGDGVQPDFGSAVHWATAAAFNGDPDAQYLLGSLYQTGMSPDLKVAVHWYAEAAEQGNVKAMHNLGIDLLNGYGVPKDPGTAAHWFERAADLGYKDSEFDLGVLYERGDGVSQDPSQALQWYQRAARVGDVEAAQRASWLQQNVVGLATGK